VECKNRNANEGRKRTSLRVELQENVPGNSRASAVVHIFLEERRGRQRRRRLLLRRRPPAARRGRWCTTTGTSHGVKRIRRRRGGQPQRVNGVAEGAAASPAKDEELPTVAGARDGCVAVQRRRPHRVRLRLEPLQERRARADARAATAGAAAAGSANGTTAGASVATALRVNCGEGQ
jgi:hypothetical protein